MDPLLFRPLIKRIRWGGTRLGTRLGKEIGELTDAAESWEIVDHGDDQSVVMQGDLSGTSLHQLVNKYADNLFGSDHSREQFPLLVKFLDANDVLSVQVHPNDVEAKKFGVNENGKTEAWVIIDAEPDSCIYAGLKEGVDRQKFLAAVGQGDVEECLHEIVVQPGDCFFIPAGTVHAIGAGILLAEIQQSSDLTFRIHDWGRVGDDGQPRELHLEEALACVDYERGPVQAVVGKPVDVSFGDNSGDESADEPHNSKVEELVACEHFVIRRWQLDQSATMETENRFRIVLVLSGAMSVQTTGFSHLLETGQTILFPASCPAITLTPGDGDVVFLETYLPEAVHQVYKRYWIRQTLQSDANRHVLTVRRNKLLVATAFELVDDFGEVLFD